jgi:hypothetical protein
VKPTVITLVPHTHWDREWYAPFDQFRQRLVAMMDTLISLGDAGFPHFHLDGQTAMIDDYLAVRPQRESDVRRLAREGRLSVGPWVTQMDEFLVSGESHLRNLERGLARAAELAPPLAIGYLPDQFGHVGQMPQILANAGIDRAVVWRGVPWAIDRTQFWWEAPDGSRVLTEYLAFGYSLGWDIERHHDAGELAASLRRKADQVSPFLAGDRMLITVGSDHSGPDATLPERVATAQQQLPGLTVRIGSLRDHLDAEPVEGLPAWRGELRSSARAHLLPNVYSARADQKRERGRVEALVERYAEPLAALVPGFRWPAKDLEEVWTLLLWNGAHDSVCGCSHDRVARDVDARYARARRRAEKVIRRALGALAAGVRASGALRFNPSPFERDGVPGLGWRVDPEPSIRGAERVEIETDGGWVLADGLAFTVEDEPDVGDLYNFCPAQDGQRPRVPTWTLISGDSAVEGVFDDGLRVRIGLARREGEAFLRLDGEIDNRRPDHRVRLLARLPRTGVGSVAGSPFELVERGPASEGSQIEAPSPTWPARHVVVAGGLAAYHEGVVEYEVSANDLVATLLRCVGTISKQHLATRPFAAGPDVPTPNAQMVGIMRFSLALQSEPSRDDLLRTWEAFALPLFTADAKGGGSLAASGTLLPVEGDAVLSSVRRVGGDLEVRLWNPHADRRVDVRVADRTATLGPARIETLRPG